MNAPGRATVTGTLPGMGDLETLNYCGTLYALPFAHLFRRLTPVEDAELRASVGALGMGHPVLVYDSPTFGPECVIDGANRLRIAGELGADAPVQKVAVDDGTARRMAEDLNIARRQVSPDEALAARQERITREVAARGEGQSYRAIAEAVGVSEKQVRKDVRKAGADRSAPASEKGAGRDGKAHPAKPRPVPDVPPITEGEQLANAVDSLARWMEEYAAKPDGAFLVGEWVTNLATGPAAGLGVVGHCEPLRRLSAALRGRT